MAKRTLWTTGLLIVISLTGCSLKLQPSWREVVPGNPTVESLRRLKAAKELFNQAGDLNSLAQSIAAFESVLEVNPGDYEALALLSNQYTLLGTAYTENRRDKSALFRKPMKFAELAMYTNPAFRSRSR